MKTLIGTSQSPTYFFTQDLLGACATCVEEAFGRISIRCGTDIDPDPDPDHFKLAMLVGYARKAKILIKAL